MMAKASDLKHYDSPTMEYIIIDYSYVLCVSPGEGESEYVGYEDWYL